MTDVSCSRRYSRRKFLSLASAGAIGTIMFAKPSKALAAKGASGSFAFIDDLGRNVRVPNIIESITPTGINAQSILCELCADKITSVALEISDADAADYENAHMGDLVELPETGALLLQNDSAIDPDVVVALSPVVMLDVGLPKEGLADKLNELQLETNIPVIFIDISFGNLPRAYRTLGMLLDCEQRAETLASYVENVLFEVRELASNQKTPCKVFYAQRQQGLAVTGGLSVQLDAISYAGAVPVVEPYDYLNKTVSVDALANIEVDWVLFDDTEVLEPLLLGTGQTWDIWSKTLSSGVGFAVSPALYHSWLGSMTFVQSIGLLWLASVLSPRSCTYDINQRAQEFYALFYGLSLADENVEELIGNKAPESVSGYDVAPQFASNHAEEVISDES